MFGSFYFDPLIQHLEHLIITLSEKINQHTYHLCSSHHYTTMTFIQLQYVHRSKAHIQKTEHSNMDGFFFMLQYLLIPLVGD